MSPDKFRKANGTITELELQHNKIGDEGAVALADSLKATLVTCVLQGLRVTVLMASVRAYSQEK